MTWSATGGTITQDGTYTAGQAGGSFSVTATSVESPSSAGSASVTIVEATPGLINATLDIIGQDRAGGEVPLRHSELELRLTARGSGSDARIKTFEGSSTLTEDIYEGRCADDDCTSLVPVLVERCECEGSDFQLSLRARSATSKAPSGMRNSPSPWRVSLHAATEPGGPGVYPTGWDLTGHPVVEGGQLVALDFENVESCCLVENPTFTFRSSGILPVAIS